MLMLVQRDQWISTCKEDTDSTLPALGRAIERSKGKMEGYVTLHPENVPSLPIAFC